MLLYPTNQWDYSQRRAKYLPRQLSRLPRQAVDSDRTLGGARWNEARWQADPAPWRHHSQSPRRVQKNRDWAMDRGMACWAERVRSVPVKRASIVSAILSAA